MLDLTIMLYGNSYTITVTEQQKPEMDKMLQHAVEGDARLLHINGTKLRVAAIVGWYFRTHQVPETERVVAALEALEKAVDQGDDWKQE